MIITSIHNEYRLRMAGVAMVIAAMGAWFAYDGAVGYPAKNREHARFAEKLRELKEAGNLPKAAEWLKENSDGVPYVEEFARKEGILLLNRVKEAIRDEVAKIDGAHAKGLDKSQVDESVARHEEALFAKMLDPPYTPVDLHTQFGFAALAFVFAAILLGVLAKRELTRVAADDAGVLRNGKRFAYSDLTDINWGQWHHKHIARLVFGNKAVTLDGWHRRGVDDIVALVLEHRKDFTMPEKPAKKE